jgi:hypothetical protein
LANAFINSSVFLFFFGLIGRGAVTFTFTLGFAKLIFDYLLRYFFKMVFYKVTCNINNLSEIFEKVKLLQKLDKILKTFCQNIAYNEHNLLNLLESSDFLEGFWKKSIGG